MSCNGLLRGYPCVGIMPEIVCGHVSPWAFMDRASENKVSPLSPWLPFWGTCQPHQAVEYLPRAALNSEVEASDHASDL